MPGPAVDVIAAFGAVEDDQRYTRLVDLFSVDAVYYDPFLGAQRGRDAIATFMATMERQVPAAGIRFDSWEVSADEVCGWARWTMVGPGPDGHDVAVPGQSLYRLRDGAVCFAADYVDPVAMRSLRPDGPAPDLAGASGLSAPFAEQPAEPPESSRPALEVVRRFWELQEGGAYAALAGLFADDAVFTDIVEGRFEGSDAIAAFLARMETEMPALGATFELVDLAGDRTVAWSQWTCRLPGGTFPGWSLYSVRAGRLTLDADYFDLVAARALTVA